MCTTLWHEHQKLSQVTVAELKIIAPVLKPYTGLCWCSTSLRKKGNVNVIVKAFGSTDFLSEATKPILKRKYFNPPTLKFLATTYLRSSRFPTTVLHVAIADVKHYFNKKRWLGKCHVTMERDIPECEDIFCLSLETLEEVGESAPKEVGHYPAQTKEMFSFPKYSSKREQIEARTLDYIHILNHL